MALPLGGVGGVVLVVGEDGTEYTESQRYGGGGGGCALAALALPGAGAALLTLSWLLEHGV